MKKANRKISEYYKATLSLGKLFFYKNSQSRLKKLLKETSGKGLNLEVKMLGKKTVVKICSKVYSKKSNLIIKAKPEWILDNLPEMKALNENEKKDQKKINETIKLSKSTAFLEFKEIVETLLIACTIAYPGSLFIFDSKITMSKKYMPEENSYFKGEYFGHSAEKADDFGWPELKNLSIAQVWNWLSNFDDVHKGYSESQIGKAINVLKYLGIDQEESDLGTIGNIVWSLIGMEALYLSGMGGQKGLLKHLKKRIAEMLGDSSDSSFLKKEINKIYRYRSKLLHGEQNFPSPYFPWDLKEKFEKFFFETYDNTFLITAILIATIQKLVERDSTSLQFQTPSLSLIDYINLLLKKLRII